MSKIVRTTLDDCRLGEEDIARLKALAQRPDSEIDLSDIPELTEDFWKNARPFREVLEERKSKRVKKITLAIDADVLAWLKRKDERGYQTRLNEVLRKAMLSEMRKERKTA